MDKKAQYYLIKYAQSNDYGLTQCYKTFSTFKSRAFEDIKRNYYFDISSNEYETITPLKIASYNSNFFTTCYLRKLKDVTDVEIVVETAQNKYIFSCDIGEVNFILEPFGLEIG